MRILIVRLGALGDIVHTVPAAAALREAFPAARIDWLVDAKHAAFAELVTTVDRIVQLARPSASGWIDALRTLRAERYDLALDFQGLLKSAVLARASGARRVVGFSVAELREMSARVFYSAVAPAAGPEHVIYKNLRLLASAGAARAVIEFPLRRGASAAREQMVRDAGGLPIALVNPGAAWPNKRWPAARFGEVAAFVHRVAGMQPFVLWGPSERGLAQDVVDASGGTARLAPPTTTADLLEVSRVASLMVSGDTGPLHIGAAAGTPLVAIFGPTDPARNGPWSPADVVVSRYGACGCSYQRRCRRASWCLDDVGVPEVTAAVERRLQAAGGSSDVPAANIQASDFGAPDSPMSGAPGKGSESEW